MPLPVKPAAAAKSTKIVKQSLAQRVSDALIEFIVTEKLPEGAALPSAAELSERFGVSRTVIREALASLVGRGVITLSQGREGVVAVPDASDLGQLLKFRLHRADVSQLNILDARLGLEVISASLAAANASDEELGLIKGELDAQIAATTDAAYHRHDVGLHRAIAVASHNPLLLMMLDALEELVLDMRVRATRNRRSRGESLEPVKGQHRAIVEAIESRDPKRAADAMRAHLESTRTELS